MSSSAESGAASPLQARQWRQIAWITAGALVLFFGLRMLPTGTNLSHMDFRVDPKAGNAIEFCDPLNPQFIPVVAARSPVTMTLATATAPRTGEALQASVMLKTGSGKAITPEDLLITHTRRLHLLIVDPTLQDYQHVHPEPTRTAGEWAFAFTPRAAGAYRVFADFTPAATARGLYASADLTVTGSAAIPRRTGSAAAGGGRTPSQTVERAGFQFALVTAQPPRAGQPIDLRFEITKPDNGPVPLELVMGAFAHLVAFDQARSGFAHLHPTEADVAKRPDLRHPVMNFKLTIPSPGAYVIWAQVNVAGAEKFVPFEFEVR